MGLPPSSDSSTANSRERSASRRAMRKRYLARSRAGIGLPCLFVGTAGGCDGSVYVGLFGEGEVGNSLASGRVCAGDYRVAGFAQLAVDEQPVAVFEPQNSSGLWAGAYSRLKPDV